MKYAIVTGGSRGIGLAIVRALLDENVVEQVAVVDKALQPVPSELTGRMHGFTADVTDEAQVHAALEALTAKLGPHPDVLCNNAGGGEANWFESGQDDDWHSVIDAAGEWRIGVQLAPNHLPPDWPDGAPQQVHLDLHIDDPRAAHEEAIALGARLLRPAPDFDAAEGHQVYADPAGHPFCIGWGHPSREALATFVADRLGRREPSQGA